MKNTTLAYLKNLVMRAFFVIKKDGLREFPKAAYGYLNARFPNYRMWIRKNETWDRQEIAKEIKAFKYKPKISIITPVYNVEPKWLDKCINSVISQYYDNWELCLYDDASTNKETIDCLKKWEGASNPKIKVSFGKENLHISGASNEALRMAIGEFVALLDNDDELSPNALYEVVKLLNEHPDADMIYSDEDKITTKGKRMEPFFKPDWSPDLFLSMMYTCHLGVYRKKIIMEIGGFREGYEGSQDYDLVLRFIEKTTPEKILHIPKVLYHWRQIPGSAAAEVDAKGYATINALKALNDYLLRNGIDGEAVEGLSPGRYRVKRVIKGNPKVSIIVPFRDQMEVLKKCVSSILEKTDYKNYEILLVDNQSSEDQTLDYLRSLSGHKDIIQLSYNNPFNYSAINNFAADKAKGEYLLFLNNDTEVVSSEWLTSMLEHAQRAEVGVVGAKLIYPNNTIQHAGVVMGLGGVADHIYNGMPMTSPGYMGQLSVIRNYSAVTAACMLTKKSLFEKTGGFDEENLTVAFNDIDFCLKIRELGFLVVFTPYALLYHHESLLRGNDVELAQKDKAARARIDSENNYMKEKWADYIENDPYYNKNLIRKYVSPLYWERL